MRRCYGRNMLQLAMAVLLSSFSISLAQAPKPALKKNADIEGSELKLVVILSRHGVRPPTWTQTRLNAYSALPWPKWDVDPGYLTPHGFELLKKFGSFDRASLASGGLIAAKGCTDAAGTYIWADTDERTMESGRALAEGLYPDCPPAVHRLAAGQRDPLFHPGKQGKRQADAEPVAAARTPSERASEDKEHEVLTEIQHVLMGCSPEKTCSPARAPEISLLDVSAPTTGAKGGGFEEAPGALALASSFAEDFLLEYTEGMPISEVGWGKVNEAQIRRFMELHTESSGFSHRTQANARIEASNMLFHITLTLKQGAEEKPDDGAIGPRKSKLVILVGHDSNISAVAGLLGLHWNLDGRKDDTPPGTELAFELWKSPNGTDVVRVSVTMQTLKQMRGNDDLTPTSPPAHQVLTMEGCGGESGECRYEDFIRLADSVVDQSSVVATSPI